MSVPWFDESLVTLEISRKYQVPISLERLHQYQYQDQKKLEITFQCKDGVQLCSRQILGQSDYFYLQANARTNFGNPLTFNYPDYSQDTIKFFLDCMYCIKPVPVHITKILEIVDFLQYEGKTIYDSFERLLVERILDAINKKTHSLGTQLLIAIILSRADNFTNTFQQKVAKKLTKGSFGSLFTEFDASSKLNRCLIELCVEKEIFKDDIQHYVTMQLMIYCRKLQELQSAVSKSKPESAQKVTEYKFMPEEIVSKSAAKRMSTGLSGEPTKRLRSENASKQTSTIAWRSSSSQQMVKMENKIWSVPRTALQWLDDNSVVVTSLDDKWENGHCILLDTKTGQSQKVDVDEWCYSLVTSVSRVSKNKFITGNSDHTVRLFVDCAVKKNEKIQ